VTNNLDIFRQEFLGANTWAQRKDGVPLDLLDNLSVDELKTAEAELIQTANLGDSWQIIGLGHIKSSKALPLLYKLLDQSKQSIRVTIARSIFQINSDQQMIDIVMNEMPKITREYELINVIYMLPYFQNKEITALLNKLRFHKEYLVAYNATQALGLSTEDVVKKFRKKDASKALWKKLFG
jgi:hypothetical protein